MTTIEDQFYIRQRDIINKISLSSVTIIGCGAVGSCLGVLLAKLGCPHIELFDGDTVEDHNIPNQYFPETALGKNKADALKDVIFNFTPPEDTLKPTVISNPIYYTDEPISGKIVFMCVDGLGNRKTVFDRLMRKRIDWVIDTRMGAEYFEVHTINMHDDDDIMTYIPTTQGDEMPLPCTGRSVIYNVMGVSTIAISLYVKMIRQKIDDYIPKKITFDYISYTLTKRYRENDDPTIII